MAVATAIRRPAGRVVAIAASAAAHAGLFLVFAWRLGERPPMAESPVMVVELTPRPARRPPEATAPEPRKSGRTDRDRREIAIRASLPPPPGVAAPVPAPFAAALDSTDARGGEVLRGLLDCRPSNLARLQSEARERCERRLAGDASVRLAAGPKLNLDPSGRYAQDEEAYLARRPKKGCKVRAAGGADAMGEEGPVAGVACVIPF